MSKVIIAYTLNFTESFISAHEYIHVKLQSPKAADDFVSGVITSIDRASHTPHIAVKRLTHDNVPCYVISYKNWNIYYSVEDDVMKVLDLVHQSQGSAF